MCAESLCSIPIDLDCAICDDKDELLGLWSRAFLEQLLCLPQGGGSVRVSIVDVRNDLWNDFDPRFFARGLGLSHSSNPLGFANVVQNT